MKKLVCAILALGCAMIILGAAGDSDLGKISATEALIRCTIALLIIPPSIKIGGFIK